MKKIYLLVLILCHVLSTDAQVGWKFDYAILTAPGWKKIVEADLTQPQHVYFDAAGFGIDYAFSLKKVNVQIISEINLMRYYQKYETSPQQTGHRFKTTIAGLHLISHIYFLDIKGDARIPAIAKKGTFWKKNLFLRPSIGLKHFESSYVVPNSVNISNFYSYGAWSYFFGLDAGLGIGLDIGLADFLKFSPIVELRYMNTGDKWVQRSRIFELGDDGNFTEVPPSDIDHISKNAITTLFGIRMAIDFR